MDYKNIGKQIMNINPDVRFVTIFDINDNIFLFSEHRAGVTNLHLISINHYKYYPYTIPIETRLLREKFIICAANYSSTTIFSFVVYSLILTK